ncbi:putative 9.1 Kda protein [Fowl aviadenovirus 4]|nr:putative 9.1 Kda protein [Fowl aviadenovirus 4]
MLVFRRGELAVGAGGVAGLALSYGLLATGFIPVGGAFHLAHVFSDVSLGAFVLGNHGGKVQREFRYFPTRRLRFLFWRFLIAFDKVFQDFVGAKHRRFLAQSVNEYLGQGVQLDLD